MATYYWVGGTGTWSDATNHWATTSGGTPNAANVPTTADDVIFDANSNVGTGAFTITIDGVNATPSVCNNFRANEASALDGTLTFAGAATAWLNVYGDFLLPTTRVSWASMTSGAAISWRATNKTVTITTNGVSLTYLNVSFQGSGGVFNLGSAFTGNNLYVQQGTLNTNNFNMTTPGGFASTGNSVRAINFGSSTITNTGISVGGYGTHVGYTFQGSNLTINAGTSTLIDTDSNAFFRVYGGPYTFYNVSWNSTTLGSVDIFGNNTFNNMTFANRTTSATLTDVTLYGDQTISGTLTTGTASSSTCRLMISSDTIGTTRTLTVATAGTLTDIDFRDVTVTGTAAPVSGTRLGNCGGNSGITFPAGKTVYVVNGGTGNVSYTGNFYATSSGGAASTSNFPLPQDTIIVNNTSAGVNYTFSGGPWNIGTFDFSARTTAISFAQSSASFYLHGNLTLSSAVTVNSSTGTIYVVGRGTQTFTTAGKTISANITLNSPGGTFTNSGAFTNTGTFTFIAGTLQVAASTTATLTSLTTSGNNLKYIRSSSAGTRGTISQTTGSVNGDKLDIKDSAATGGASFRAVGASVDNGNNTGWFFTGNLMPMFGVR